MNEKKKIVIIGGGLSGLTLAYLLSKEDYDITVLEASERLGGRIQTVHGQLETPLELGATWFSDMHPNLLMLIDELGLKKFPQYTKGLTVFQTKSFEPPQTFFIPEAENPSYRLVGGTQTLIDALAAKLPKETVQPNTKVIAIKEAGDGLLVETANGKKLNADYVAVCIPPQLAAVNIEFVPALKNSLVDLLPVVQTWMVGALKFVVEYDEPFWRNDGYSGMLYSHADIVVEMYDHTNFEETKFGFTGFLNGSTASYTQQVRKELVLKHLNILFGRKALQPTAYFDKVWTNEFLASGTSIANRPHENNGHPLLQEPYMNEKLFFANTETAAEFPGYMEGAVNAAIRVGNRINK